MRRLGKTPILNLQQRRFDQGQPAGFLEHIPRAAITECGEWGCEPLLQPIVSIKTIRTPRFRNDLQHEFYQAWRRQCFTKASHTTFWSHRVLPATAAPAAPKELWTDCGGRHQLQVDDGYRLSAANQMSNSNGKPVRSPPDVDGTLIGESGQSQTTRHEHPGLFSETGMFQVCAEFSPRYCTKEKSPKHWQILRQNPYQAVKQMIWWIATRGPRLNPLNHKQSALLLTKLAFVRLGRNHKRSQSI